MPVYEDKSGKNGKKYYYKVYYTGTDGKYKQYKSKRFELKRDCIKAEAEFRANLDKYKEPSPLTFAKIGEEFFEFRKPQLRPNSVRSLKLKLDIINELIGDIKLDELTPQMYREFYNKIQDSVYKTKYKNNLLGVVKRLCKYSGQMHSVSSTVPFQFDNFKDRDSSNEYNIYTLEQFRKYLSVISNQLDRAIFSTLFYCGLRRGELFALTWNDINFDKGTININKSMDASSRKRTVGPTKTQYSKRVIPMPKLVEGEIKKVRVISAKYEGFSENWFVFGGIRSVSAATVQQHNKIYAEKAGLNYIRLHDFRHSCASLLINELRIPITSISKYLGHENPKITLSTYSHFYQENLDRISIQIDNLTQIHS